MEKMDRRGFLQGVGVLGAATLLGGDLLAAKRPEVAITLDDPKTEDYPGHTAAELDERLRSALRSARVSCALFICGKRVDSDAGRQLMSAWNADGHILGNHSYSHLYYHSKKVDFEQFAMDAEKGESVVSGYSHFRKIFRFPFFKEGDTEEKRDRMRAWLAERKYLTGRATIDASDWAIDARLKKRLAEDSKTDLKPYRDFYLEHIWERSLYYDVLAQEVWKHPVKHTLLLHHSLLNALFIEDLVEMYRERGWRVIPANDAYRDPVYQEQPKILPAGESLVWALSKQQGATDLRYPAEDGEYEDPKMDMLKL